MEFLDIPIIDKNLAGRELSNLVKWMIGKDNYTAKMSDATGFSPKTCREKIRRNILTLNDLLDLAPSCGYTLALVKNQTGEAYDLGGYLKQDKNERSILMKVVLCEPGKKARMAEIGNKLEDMQKVVGGLIQAVYPFTDNVALVCNEEGKIDGLPLNRALFAYDSDPDTRSVDITDFICGTFFICGLGEDDFDSLSDMLLEKYEHRFRYPEKFVKDGNHIYAARYDGEE